MKISLSNYKNDTNSSTLQKLFKNTHTHTPKNNPTNQNILISNYFQVCTSILNGINTI